MLERVGSMGTRALRDLHMHLHNGSDVMVLNTTVDVFPEEFYRCMQADPAYGEGVANALGILPNELT